MTVRSKVIGVGNRWRGDDAAGLAAARVARTVTAVVQELRVCSYGALDLRLGEQAS